jgi:xanthine dehydrogenase YagT iron-sulfur-binding subunit
MDDPAKGLSRRSFLKGATGVAALSTLPTTARALEPGEAVVEAPRQIAVALEVNGQPQAARVTCRTTLVEMLREDFGLTGTKVACASGDCGACTVLVDGQAVAGCLMLAAEAEGARVTTIEGLARGEELHPIQQAFIDTDALQCGFCTPGQIMACAGLLAKNPKPDDEAIRHGMAGNLCRCGAYANIFAAVKKVAGRE